MRKPIIKLDKCLGCGEPCPNRQASPRASVAVAVAGDDGQWFVQELDIALHEGCAKDAIKFAESVLVPGILDLLVKAADHA